MKKQLFTLSVLSMFFMLGCSEEDDFVTPALSIEEEIFQLVNQHRSSEGLSPLVLDGFISDVSRMHSRNMATGAVDFGHDGFSDRVAQIKAELGGSNSGENVALGYPTAEAVMDGWINSSGHRANIEGNFTHIGIGVFESEGGQLYYTQIFINI